MVNGLVPNRSSVSYRPVNQLNVGDLYSHSLDGDDSIFVLLEKGGPSIGASCILRVNHERRKSGMLATYSLGNNVGVYHVGSMLPSALADELKEYKHVRALDDAFLKEKIEELKASRSNGNALRPTPVLSAP